MKGMLTGPVTILNWSFVRDDNPRSAACRQIALAIRDEVVDLEAGRRRRSSRSTSRRCARACRCASRTGRPISTGPWNASASARRALRDETQIHTHMCYSEFNDIIDAIGAMDADVISIETSRSKMELLDAFKSYRYPNEIGPGVYDIHSPRVPGTSTRWPTCSSSRGSGSPTRQLWVNPDCGLKTRKWEEVRPALVNMVAAARELRALA